ncbi:MAG TPA: glutathione S-transferase family protein [Candidatus Binataceae bacterium]|nr:glutathione S-transferase family protein [Candidatus Binataceae bacterium]
MAKLVLYDFPVSTHARKVRMVMAEKGIAYDRINVDLRAGEQKRPEYLKLNPHGHVPTLMVDGTPLYESTAIIEYLDETQPNPPMLPKEPLARARARMIEEVVDSAFIGALRMVRLNTQVRAPEKRNAEELAEGRAAIAWHNAWFDRELAGKEFFCSSQMTVADIAAFCDLAFQKIIGVEIDPGHRHLVEWLARMESRPSSKA